MENETKKAANPLLVPVILLSACVVVLALLLIFRQPAAQTLQPAETTAATETVAAMPAVDPDSDVVLSVDTDLCIPTAYTTLHMPEQWAGSIHVVQSKRGSAYAYTFYAMVENREEMGIFVIHFNEDGETFLGTLSTGDGSEVYLGLTAQELDFDDSWTSDEIDLVCAMQESTNYMLEALTASAKFTPAK